MTEKKVLCANILISYFDTGGQGPILLFLHGWGANKELFCPLMKALSTMNYRCIAFDFPGFGKSQSFPTSANMQQYAEITHSFCNKIGKPQVLFGHSFGGRVIAKLHLMKKLPKLSHIIVCGSAGIPNILSLKQKTLQYVSKVFQQLSKIFGESLRSQCQKIWYKILKIQDVEGMSASMRETFKAVISEDLTQGYENIQIPMLLLWGAHDQETPLWQANKIHSFQSNRVLKVYQNAGHYVFLEEEKACIREIKNFLQHS